MLKSEYAFFELRCEMEGIFPIEIEKVILEKIGKSNINEIRMRANSPIVVFSNNSPYNITENGLSKTGADCMFATKEMIENIVFRACECSIYAAQDQIRNGFVTAKGGIRIGVCGEVVSENGVVKTMKNFSSLNIRFPHAIRNCSLGAYPFVVKFQKVLNTLVISPPAAGKTTFLRDLVWQLCDRENKQNILVLDERGEIWGGGEFDLGDNCDVLCSCSKKNGFIQSIRAMNPDVIVADEIGSSEDLEAVKEALTCGVSVVASVHADSLSDLKKKSVFKNMFEEKWFQRYVILSKNNGVGTYEGVFGENFERLGFFG